MPAVKRADRAPLTYSQVINVLDLVDRRGWYERLTDAQKKYLKVTALHQASGAELYRVDQVLDGHVVLTATVSRAGGSSELRRQRLRYCVTSCRTMPGQPQLHGPFFYYFRTRTEADAAAANAIEWLPGVRKIGFKAS
jgi:hypothetical protein